MKADRIQAGMKIQCPDGTVIEIIRGWFQHEGFDSVEYRFADGSTEIAAVAFIQEVFKAGAKEII